MDVKKELEILAPVITKNILDVISAEQARVKGQYDYIDEIWLKIIDLLQGGKRLRGAFLYYSYLMHGGKDKDEALKASVLPELIHLYLLIVDDFQDKCELRRNVSTLNKVYREKHLKEFKKRDPVHFGNSIAVLGGLFVNHLSFNYFSQLNFPLQEKIDAIARINGQIVDVGYGQTLDIFSESMEEVTEKSVMNILLLKTAKYTYEGPLQIGAILAGASEADLKILSDYAIPAGMAFQIQDDILGMFGEEEKMGKTANSDLIEGKQTLLIVKALELAGAKGKNFIKQSLGNPDLTSDDVRRVQEIVTECGSLDYAKLMCKNFVAEAKKNLAKSKFKDNVGYEFITGIADYMVNRAS